MSKTITLRDKILKQHEDYKLHDAMKYWEDEGIPFAIMDYSSLMGSVMEFSEDDWRTCKDYGWSIHDVCDLCGEPYFFPNVSSLEEFLRLYIEEWQSRGVDDMTGDQIADAIQDYFTWSGKLLPRAQKIYCNG